MFTWVRGWGRGEVRTCPETVNSLYKLPLKKDLKSEIIFLEPHVYRSFLIRKKHILVILSEFTHLQMGGKRKSRTVRSLIFFLVLRSYDNKIPCECCLKTVTKNLESLMYAAYSFFSIIFYSETVEVNYYVIAFCIM